METAEKMNFTLIVNMTMGMCLIYFEFCRLQHCLLHCISRRKSYCTISNAEKVIVVMELIFASNQKTSMLQNVNLDVNAVMGTTETL